MSRKATDRHRTAAPGARAAVFVETLRVLGVMFTLRTYGARLVKGIVAVSWLKPSAHSHDDAFDELLGVESDQQVSYLTNRPTAVDEHAGCYEPARVDVVRAALRHISCDRSATHFLDLGSGKARVVLLAASEGFRWSTGVELNPELHEIAARNLELARSQRNDGNIQLLLGSAVDAELPTGPLVVFMFHPFDGPVFDAVARLLAERARSADAPMWIVYVNPVFRHMIERTGVFAVMHESRVNPVDWSTIIYRADSKTL